MSYHETYEFFAIDRRLTPAEMRALRRISTRATITPTWLYNHYEWGGLKADPRDLVRRYFDLFVYTEWRSGERWAAMRFPAARVDRRAWRAYVAEARSTGAAARCATVTSLGKTVLLDLYPPEDPRMARSLDPDEDDEREYWSNDDIGASFDDGEVDEASLGVPLALVRSELLAGNLGALYLLWLSSVQCGERRTTALEPPRPAGLDRISQISCVLASFVEFMRLDEELLAVALEPSRSERRTAGALHGRDGPSAGVERRNARRPGAPAASVGSRNTRRRNGSKWLASEPRDDDHVQISRQPIHVRIMCIDFSVFYTRSHGDGFIRGHCQVRPFAHAARPPSLRNGSHSQTARLSEQATR